MPPPTDATVAVVNVHPRRLRVPAAWRPRRPFVLGLLLSLVVHLAFWFWPEPAPQAADDVPLTATITALPPPPPITPRSTTATSSTPRTHRPVAAHAPKPLAMPANAPERPALLPPPVLVETPDPIEPIERSASSATDDLLAPPIVALAAKTLPPRVDLVYRVFWGTQGFYIGDATYRLEHDGDRYRIATVGEARGLAALIMRGQGKLESEGTITGEGLRPDHFALVRGKGRKREIATFDWPSRTVMLEDDKSAALDTPTYDPLAFLWQFYFLPPETGRETFAIATTRRLYHYTFTRETTETLELASGPVETERWHRRSDDGKSDAYVWLAPSLRYVAVKLRVANTERGTVEVLLEAIRVDETAAARP